MAYPTSDIYNQIIKQQVRDTTITGTLTTANGNVIEINNALISAGSLYITNQCVNGEGFEYGTVFAAELGMTIKSNVDRYSLYDGVIEISYNLLISSGTYETIPLGKYYISEATRSGEAISIKAYDGMLNLDTPVSEDIFGTPYELLSVVSTRCNIELGQTEDEIKALVNGEAIFNCNKDNIETYRDLVAYIGMCTCTFAVVGRDGKLRLAKYQTSSPKKLSAKQRASGKFSDFTTYYSRAIARMMVSGEYCDYIKEDTLGGLTYDFGDIPIVQGTPETNQAILDNIFTELKAVNNVPCDVTFAGDPAIDLGDLVQNTDIKGEVFTSNVTFYKWTYHGKHQLKSAGANPKLASRKEKTNGANAGVIGDLESQIKSKTTAVYTATNAKELKLKYHDDFRNAAKVLRVAYATTSDNTAIMIVTVEVQMDKDGFVEFAIFVDSIQFDDRTIIQYCQKGQSTITFATYIPCVANHTYRVEVFGRTFYEETQLRVNEAKAKTNENARLATTEAFNSLLATLQEGGSVSDIQQVSYDIVKPDTSCPTGIIPALHAKGVVFGQGLSGVVKWDGTLTFTESFEKHVLSGMVANHNFSSEVGTVVSTPYRSEIAEAFSAYKYKSMKAGVIKDNGLVQVTVQFYKFSTKCAEYYTYDRSLVTVEDNVYKLSSDTPAMIYSEEISLTHETIKGIEAAYVTCTGDITIAISFDDKKTWKGWTGTEWGLYSEDFTGMSKANMEAITQAQWDELFAGAQRCYLRVSLLDATQSVELITLDFVN